MSNEQYINWTIRLFDKMDKVIKPNGKILYNMSYGCENTECMNLTVAEIIKKTNFTLGEDVGVKFIIFAKLAVCFAICGLPSISGIFINSCKKSLMSA
jgi:hypothetical protein